MSDLKRKVACVKATGERYLVKGFQPGKVRCHGEVLRISGMSTAHGPDKVFLAEKVEVQELSYTAEMLTWLAGPKEPEPPKRKPWVTWEKQWDGKRRALLTEHAMNELKAEGYDVGMDGLGNYLDESMLQDAAMDSAMYHSELTADGVKQGLSPCREAAADYIYDGMLKALKEKRKNGESVEMTR